MNGATNPGGNGTKGIGPTTIGGGNTLRGLAGDTIDRRFTRTALALGPLLGKRIALRRGDGLPADNVRVTKVGLPLGAESGLIPDGLADRGLTLSGDGVIIPGVIAVPSPKSPNVNPTSS